MKRQKRLLQRLLQEPSINKKLVKVQLLGRFLPQFRPSKWNVVNSPIGWGRWYPDCDDFYVHTYRTRKGYVLTFEDEAYWYSIPDFLTLVKDFGGKNDQK